MPQVVKESFVVSIVLFVNYLVSKLQRSVRSHDYGGHSVIPEVHRRLRNQDICT